MLSAPHKEPHAFIKDTTIQLHLEIFFVKINTFICIYIQYVKNKGVFELSHMKNYFNAQPLRAWS